MDNQSALATLQSGNPTNSEFTHHSLTAMRQLQDTGWQVAGLWKPAHCGIPGNERADMLAKQIAQTPNSCKHSRATKCRLQASAHQQLTTDWSKQFSAGPLFPIPPSATFPKDLIGYSPTSLRALFRLQTGTTPSDPHPSKPPEICQCGADRISTRILLEYPSFQEARTDLLPPCGKQEIRSPSRTGHASRGRNKVYV